MAYNETPRTFDRTLGTFKKISSETEALEYAAADLENDQDLTKILALPADAPCEPNAP